MAGRIEPQEAIRAPLQHEPLGKSGDRLILLAIVDAEQEQGGKQAAVAEQRVRTAPETARIAGWIPAMY